MQELAHGSIESPKSCPFEGATLSPEPLSIEFPRQKTHIQERKPIFCGLCHPDHDALNYLLGYRTGENGFAGGNEMKDRPTAPFGW